MKSYYPKEENLIYYVLWFICIGSMSMDVFASGQVPVGRTGRHLTSSEISSYENQKAIDAYKKRNAEIDLPIQGDVVPCDNNAALLYYQALLLLPDTDKALQTKIDDVCRGAEPDTSIRIFLGQCLPTLEMLKIASRISDCTWGTWSERDRIKLSMSQKLYDLRRAISVDAHTLASDGHYHAALDQCLTLRRIARHLSENSILDIFTMSYDSQALQMIRYILNEMPLNTDTLSWLQGQLALVQVIPSGLERELHRCYKLTIEEVQSSSVASLREILIVRATDEQVKKRLRDLTDEQVRHEMVQMAQGLYGSIFTILHSDKSAEQKQAEIKKLSNAYKVEFPIFALAGVSVGKQFESELWHMAQINNIRAAVDIYLIFAKTGRLPEKLPEHLPKDPFTGDNFIYEIADEGFLLHYGAESIPDYMIKENEYKITQVD